MPTVFPAAFAELEPFAEWAIPTERARYAKRVASTMDELQAFYDAAFPRIDDALRVPRAIPDRRHPRGRDTPAVALLRVDDGIVPG